MKSQNLQRNDTLTVVVVFSRFSTATFLNKLLFHVIYKVNLYKIDEIWPLFVQYKPSADNLFLHTKIIATHCHNFSFNSSANWCTLIHASLKILIQFLEIIARFQTPTSLSFFCRWSFLETVLEQFWEDCSYYKKFNVH